MYLISYDIASDKIRNKVAKELENYGKRVQYSVFECDISNKLYQELYEKLIILMRNEKVGNIRIYQLCGRCEKNIQTIGIKNQNAEIDDEGVIII